MPILYSLVLVTCTALTLLLMLPGNALLASIFAQGTGIPLLFLFLTATLLLWTLLPAAFFWRTRARWPLVALGLGVPTLLLALPSILSDRAAARLVGERGIIQPAALPLTSPIGIEIVRNVQHNLDLFARSAGQSALYGDAPCFDLCERLLLGGQVAWVRIVLRDDAVLTASQRSQALFVPGSAAACTAANPDLSAPCVLFAPDHGLAPGLTLDLEDHRILPEDRLGSWPFVEIGRRTATAYLGTDPSQIIYRARQVFHDRPTGLIGFELNNLGDGDGGGKLALLRERDATAPIDLAAAFTAMGFALGPIRAPLPKAPGTESNPIIQPPPDAQDAAYVASMLATGPEGAETFSSGFRQVVNGWHQHLRWKPKLSAGDTAIFCASLGDPRIGGYYWSDQVIDRHQLTCS